MLGRAGRPQYDTFGEGVIVTGHGELQFYLSLLNQQLPIESQLVSKLPDALNAEVVLGNVSNVREAANWLGYTYLYVRMLRNPALYGVTPEEREADPLLLQRRLDLAHTAAALLDRHNLLRYDRRTGAFQPTALGRVASHYYVSHTTIATYNEYLRPSLGDIELLRLFSLSGEFKNVVVRTEEKEELRRLVERVPIPVKESVEEPSAKVNVLLQAYISGLGLEGLALAADMVYVQQSAGRLVRAMFEIALRRGWAALAQRALTLAKMIDHRQWQSASPLRQFSSPRGATIAGAAAGGAAGGLPEEVLRRLERKDIGWERFHDLKPADLGELVRLPKLGKAIHRLVHAIPRLEVAASVQPITRSLLRVDVTLTPDFGYDPRLHGPSEAFWVTVEDTDGEIILHAEQFSLKARFAEEEHRLTMWVPLTEPTPPQYFIRVVSDRWLHSATLLPLPFRHLALPDKFSPPTELLDLAPLPVAALKNAEAEALFTAGAGAGLGAAGALTHFNPVQTQTFGALYEGDGNVLVGAPSGSGKTLCAEFALLRLFARDPDARAVYVAPRDDTVRLRFAEWEHKFGRGLGKAVVELTGELAADLKLLERAHIVLATPRNWDVVSRRWKKRRAVQSVRLFVADDLEALASPELGPVYEVVVSRMRFMGLQLAAEAAAAGGDAAAAKPLRLVGLSTSIANARDVGDWLGAGPSGTFGFHPQVRPVPLEIRIQGFDSPHAGSRLVAMARPAYAACAQFASGPAPGASGASAAPKPALVFVPSRKQAQLTAIDLMTFAAADGQGDRFLRGRATVAQVDDAVARAGVRDGALAATLRAGVGIWHDGMRPAERALVERLYAGGHVGVVVATAASSWAMGGSTWGASAVVIMGTEGYDGRSHGYVDYPLADVLHMMGRAARPGRDDTGRVVILCAGHRKEYLKRFLYEPLPVESALATGHALADTLCAEVVSGVVESKQDALDYLTWTLLYRRLPANPAFYGLAGTSHRHLSDFLSELVDATVGDLEAARCVAVGDDGSALSALNLGMIASYYNVAYTTLELFASSLGPKTKMRGLLEILSNASEFDGLEVRHGEDRTLRSLAAHLPLALPPPPAGGRSAASQYHDPHIKAYVLLQAHFSRLAATLPSPELRADVGRLLPDALNLLYALVDVVSSEGHLKPALAAMELAQMTVQGLWADRDPPLLQVPHVGAERAAALAAGDAASGVEPLESVFDLMSLDDGVRRQLLAGLSPAQLGDVARFCNRYPNIDVAFTAAAPVPALAPDGGDVTLATGGSSGDETGAPAGAAVPAGETVTLRVNLTREASTEGMDEGAGIGAVHAPHYPRPKAEGWWLVVGSPAANTIHAIKRVTLAGASSVKLNFPAPPVPGHHDLTLYFMCDSYTGCDQEYSFGLDVVAEAAAGEDGAVGDEAMQG
jgi:pre-mRNA-splicing helicase BRR2